MNLYRAYNLMRKSFMKTEKMRYIMEQDEIYGEFAYVYDEFMDNIPYEQWHDYLHKLLIKYGIKDGIVADLACGTGTMTKLLADDGYDMIGVDMSYEMLEVARQKYCCQSFEKITDENEDESDDLKDFSEYSQKAAKMSEDESGILFLNQDMRELDLYGTAAAMVCICDGMNYITDENDLLRVFEKVKIFLDFGGIFIFDMKTRHFYENVLGSRTVAENRENASFIWENEFDKDTGINEYLLTIYSLVDDENDLFERSEEVHHQRAYDVQNVRDCLEKAGLSCLAVYDAFTENTAKEDSERIYFVAQRPD